MIDPESHETNYSYDVIGNNLNRLDSNNNLWKKLYDKAGNLVEQSSPIGAVNGYRERFEYDGLGNMTASIAPNGHTVTYIYDARDRLVSKTEIPGKPALYSYDGEGRLLSSTDEEGRQLQYRYDLEGRRVLEIDGNGNSTAYQYTANGLPGSETRGQPAVIIYPTFTQTMKYDSRSRLIELTDVLPDGQRHVQKMEFDDTDNLTVIVDKESRTNLYEYDALNRVITEVDEMGVRTELAYDNRDNMISVTSGSAGGKTLFEYDRNNRRTGEIQPLGERDVAQYDGEGNISSVVKADGSLTTYQYDDDNRLIQEFRYVSGVGSSSTTINYTYNNINKLTGYDDGVVAGSFTFDIQGRKISDLVNYGPFESMVTYSWFANNSLRSVTDPAGETTSYNYDGANLWSGASVANVGSVVVNDREWQEVTKITYPGGTTREMTYTPQRYLNAMEITSPVGNAEVNYQYSHSVSGRVVGMETEYGLKSYDYDFADRLISAVNSNSPDVVYTYDDSGNRLSDSGIQGNFSYNENNQLVATPLNTFAYDQNGSRTSRTSASQSLTYHYDESERLSRVTDLDGGAEVVLADYGYDPFGRRLWKEVNSIRTYFIYSAQGLAAEADELGNIIRRYGYRPDRTWMTDPLYLQDALGNLYFYMNDHIGTPQKLLDLAGSEVWAQEPGVFGEPHVLVNIVQNPLRFPGQYFDEETGLHYNYHRTYDPAYGRYLESDPIGLRGGRNVYGYVAANPINAFDPQGLAGFFALEGSGSIGPFGGGGGVSFVGCRNACGQFKNFRYWKWCGGRDFGKGLGAGGSAIGGYVWGMDGADCYEDRYNGWFLEFSGALAGFSVGYDIGFSSGWGGLPYKPNGVYELGVGAGIPGASIMWCKYTAF